MIHLGVRSIPKVLSWFQTQTDGTHTLNWYTLVIYWDAPSQIEGLPLAGLKQGRNTNPSPKRRIEGGCSTSKTLACPEKVFLVVISGKKWHHKRRTTKGMRKKKLPGMRDTSWQMSLHFRLGIAEKSPSQKDVTSWGQLPYIPKWLPIVLVAHPPPKKKKHVGAKILSPKNRIKHQIFGKLSGILSLGVADLPPFPPTSSLGELGEGGESTPKKLSDGVKKDL